MLQNEVKESAVAAAAASGGGGGGDEEYLQQRRCVSIEGMSFHAKPITLLLQSSKLTISMGVSGDVLKTKSALFATMLSNESEDEQGLVLPESDPQEAADFLVYVHKQAASLRHPPLPWNKSWASLACKWMMDAYIDEFAHLAKDIIHTEEFKPKLPSTPLDAEVKARFWDVASTVLLHEPMKKSPAFGHSAFFKLLAGNKELWDEQQMKQLLSADDFFALCNTKTVPESSPVNNWIASTRCVLEGESKSVGSYNYSRMFNGFPVFLRSVFASNRWTYFAIFRGAYSGAYPKWWLSIVRDSTTLCAPNDVAYYYGNETSEQQGSLMPPSRFLRCGDVSSMHVSNVLKLTVMEAA